MKSDKIKNVKGTQSNKFEFDAEPQLSQTYMNNAYSSIHVSQQFQISSIEL